MKLSWNSRDGRKLRNSSDSRISTLPFNLKLNTSKLL
jgi:hypothetical protein